MATPLVLLLLATFGALDTAYLSFSHLFGSDACAAGSGCGEVTASSHSSAFGIPLSVYGLGLYLAIWVTAWRGLREDERGDAIRVVSLLAVLGNLPTLYLLYLQAFVIRAWCPFCLLSAAVILAIFIVAWRASDRQDPGRSVWGPALHLVWVPPAMAIVLPVLLYPLAKSGVSQMDAPTRVAPDEIVAEIGDRKILSTEMDAALRIDLQEVKDRLRREWLNRQVLETEASNRGVSVRDLVGQEVDSKVEITPEEVDRRWDQIRDRLRPGTTRADVEASIRRELTQHKTKPALDGYVATLRARYNTVYRPPSAERFALDPNPRGGPEKGSPNAPVTIVEYSDLECSHCAGAHRAISGLVRRRPDDVRVVFRHNPLNRHPHARYAAEVAACAQQQGKFWAVADRLFANQENMNKDTIRQHAEEVGLKLGQLDACLESGDGASAVQADIDEADSLGVGSTPTFFVNGHYIGSMPREGFDAVVDREMR